MTSMHMTMVPEFPRPHQFDISFAIPIERAATNGTTMVPVIVYDEGQGAMSAYESNPENANFVEAATPNCFPSSKINKIFCEATVSMSKIMLETDKVHAVNFATMKIHTAFNELVQANDEVSTLNLEEILEMQTEATDRQSGPLYNAIDMHDYKTNADLDMAADQAFLDTDLEIEGIGFSENQYYDCLHFMTNGHKLAQVSDGLQWHTLTRQRPFKKIRWSQASNTKFMNPFAFLGILFHVPTHNTHSQMGKVGDTTIETSTLEIYLKFRYNEFNHEFNHSML